MNETEQKNRVINSKTENILVANEDERGNDYIEKAKGDK